MTGAVDRRAPGVSPDELVLRDLLDVAVVEDVAGLASATLGDPPPGLPARSPGADGRWVTVAVGDGVVAWPAGDGAPTARTRHAGGPAWHLPADGSPRPVTADRLLTLLDPGGAHADDVAADLRTAVEHAQVVTAGRDRLPADAVTPRRGDPAAALLAGERLAATRGRPFHPTARAAVGWSARDLDRWGPTGGGAVTPAWVLVRRDHLRLGPDPRSSALHTLVVDDPGPLGAADDRFQLLPVHPSDHERVLAGAFADEIAAGVVVPLEVRAGELTPTASLRTLAIAGATDPVRHLKLPLGIATLGAARLLPPRYLDNADRARRTLDAVLAADPALAACVGLCDEGLWAGFTAGPDSGPDSGPEFSPEFTDRPGRLAAQVRTYPDLGALPLPLAALAAHEWDVLGPVLGVDGLDDARRLLADLARTVVGVAVGFLAHGVLPEMHGQNVVVGVGENRLVLRDHDTVRVHRDWLDVPEPGYRIAPGAAQTLVLDRPEDLVAYLPALVVGVALRGVADALGRHLGVAEHRWWPVLGGALEEAVAGVGEPVRAELERVLFAAEEWPARSVLGPVLARGASGGVSMPAGTVRVPNPLRRR